MIDEWLHGLAPSYLSSLFIQRNISYNLRDNENILVIPLTRTNFLKRVLGTMVRSSGITFSWNCGKQKLSICFEGAVTIVLVTIIYTRHPCKTG